MRIVDLSVPTGPGPGEPLPPDDRVRGPRGSAPLLAQIFGCEAADLPDGQGWASETVTLITHAGTHVDAPWHYFPTSGGERARTIDELPLDWFVRPGVRLDVRERPWGERIEAEHLEAALAAAGHTLAPLRHRAAVDRRRATRGTPPSTSTPAPASRARRRRGCSSRA